MATRTVRRSKSGATALPPAKRVIEPIDLDEDFSDVSGDPGSDFSLIDGDGEPIGPKGDATYRYMWCEGSDAQFGPGYWKRDVVPWEEVYFEEGGVSVKGLTFKSGDRIESRGQVLMRCSRAKREKRERYERVKTELQNRAMAKERQADVDLSSDDPGERAAVVRQHRASGSSLNYQNAQG